MEASKQHIELRRWHALLTAAKLLVTSCLKKFVGSLMLPLLDDGLVGDGSVAPIQAKHVLASACIKWAATAATAATATRAVRAASREHVCCDTTCGCCYQEPWECWLLSGHPFCGAHSATLTVKQDGSAAAIHGSCTGQAPDVVGCCSLECCCCLSAAMLHSASELQLLKQAEARPLRQVSAGKVTSSAGLARCLPPILATGMGDAMLKPRRWRLQPLALLAVSVRAC